MNNELIKISHAFSIEGKNYCLKQYSVIDVVTKILPKFYFDDIKNLTYEQIVAITTMYNCGFEMIPGFYGQRLGSGTVLSPMYNWFTMTGFDKKGKHHHIVVYLNYTSTETGIKLYMDYRLVGSFNYIKDLMQYTCIMSIIPTKFETYYVNPILENYLTDFESNGMTFDDVYGKDDVIFALNTPSTIYSIDYDKLVEFEIDENEDIEIITYQQPPLLNDENINE